MFAYGADSRLHVVPAVGGTAEPLMTDAAPGRQPEVLPDGRTVLFEAAGHIHAYDRRAGAITKLLPGTAPRYANGQMIFSRGTTLLAAPINVENSSMEAAIPVTAGVAAELPGSGGGRHYAIPRNGALVYVPTAEAYQLVVVGPNAVENVVGQLQRSLETRRFARWSLPGRGRQRREEEPAELWLHDLRAFRASYRDDPAAPRWPRAA